MDAQNAAEPASTKLAASPKRPGSDTDQPRAPAVTKTSSTAKPELSLNDNKPSASGRRPGDEDGGADGNSDAETIVLPGKDGHSPSKVRRIIKHEKSDTEDGPSLSSSRKHSNLKPDRDGDRAEKGDKIDRAEKVERSMSVTGTAPNENIALLASKKKKHLDKTKSKDGSNDLSSAPGSPPQPQRRRRPSNDPKSDSDTAPAESVKAVVKDKLKSPDKVLPHKRKAPRPDSDDEAENRKIRRQRTSGSGLDASRKPHPPPKLHHHEAQPSTRTRSISPHSRAHRRSISTQLPGHATHPPSQAPHSSNGLGQKKKRIPAPLQSIDYQSDESSASNSPHPRSSKIRGLATPAHAESTVSPAKMAPHKKHLDAHGQTFLARACAKGEFQIAKQRLQERPEDINVADYAGNTPLQIAALNGYDDIVRLLVDAGCNLDCVNNDKDTPLLDAVENGHLDVVKILLDAGVNPRKANAYGQEPIDRVNNDLDYADEIRRALEEAKQKMGERRRTSEEHHPDPADTRSSHGPDSPRRSPGAASSMHAGGGRRAGTVRATKTSNHLLYMPMDDKTLRAASARGDEETVTRILQVRENFDDPESMVAAARGGHDIVMQLLLALGRANPDPPPIPNSNSEYSTPILAAIGQENIKVVRLLLDQTNFDPTRLIKGETYYEIARRRRGPNWMEEEHMLKDAFDEYKKTHKETSKTRSPGRREQERESKRRIDSKREESTKAHKRRALSPAGESRNRTTNITTSPKERRRANSIAIHQDDQTSIKRGPGRPTKEDRIPTIAISDREVSPAGKPTTKVRRAESDLAAISSEGETVKPRRKKLVSGRELKGERERERERQRRPSLTSNASSLKEPSSPREEFEKRQKIEKYHDRTMKLKRNESRDRLSVSGESTGKRYRSSATPPHLGLTEKDDIDAPTKRRRLDVDGKEKRPKSSQSDDRFLKASLPREPSSGSAGGHPPPSKSRDEESRKLNSKPKKTDALLHQGRRESGKSVSSDGSIHVKSEDPDVEMSDAIAPVDDSPHTLPRDRQEQSGKEDVLKVPALHHSKREESKPPRSEFEARVREARRREEERQRRDDEDKEKERLRREEEAKRVAEAEARQREAEERRQKEEEDRKRKEQEERRRREEQARKQREEEEERRRLQDEERKRLEEEEKRRQEEARRQKEEEERKRREEEERLRREQLEREAAEEARRKRDEEEKKEQERKERALREEMDRRRAAREAERQRIHLEQERARLAKLPPVLRWLDGADNPKLPEVAEKFSIMQGVRYDCINPAANGTRDGREQWLLNTQVALLLGEKDLQLSRCKLRSPSELDWA
jgi:ankyrin repeat protein